MRRQVLVGVSDRESSTAAVDWAAAEAARRELPVHVVHSLHWLLQNAVGDSARVREDLLRAGRESLQEAVERVHARAPELDVETTVELELDPASALLSRADSAELVVLGSRERSTFGDVIAGSATIATVRHAPCPVVVVRPHATRAQVAGAGAGEVVVGVDGSEVSSRAVEAAFAEASLWGCGLTAVHVWQPATVGAPESFVYGVLVPSDLEQAREAHGALLSEALAGWRDKHPDVPVREVLVEGHAGGALVEASRDARLLVVGTRGRGGFAGLLLGSVSSAVLHHADCPVMVCHR